MEGFSHEELGVLFDLASPVAEPEPFRSLKKKLEETVVGGSSLWGTDIPIEQTNLSSWEVYSLPEGHAFGTWWTKNHFILFFFLVHPVDAQVGKILENLLVDNISET